MMTMFWIFHAHPFQKGLSLANGEMRIKFKS